MVTFPVTLVLTCNGTEYNRRIVKTKFDYELAIKLVNDARNKECKVELFRLDGKNLVPIHSGDIKVVTKPTEEQMAAHLAAREAKKATTASIATV